MPSTKLMVFLHQPNQLIRSYDMDNDIGSLRNKKKYELYIKVKHIQLMRKRHNSKEKCDKHLVDDGTKWMQTTSEMLGCVPIFWKIFAKSWNNIWNISYCTKYENYREFHSKYALNPFYVFEQYAPPCTRMSVLFDTASKENDDENGDGELKFHVQYNTYFIYLFISILGW